MALSLSISKAISRPQTNRFYTQIFQQWVDYANIETTNTSAVPTTSTPSSSFFNMRNILNNDNGHLGVLKFLTNNKDTLQQKMMSSQLQSFMWIVSKPVTAPSTLRYCEEESFLEEVEDDEDSNEIAEVYNKSHMMEYAVWLSSTLKKRKAKMNKHKLKKRRKKLGRKSKAKKN